MGTARRRNSGVSDLHGDGTRKGLQSRRGRESAGDERPGADFEGMGSETRTIARDNDMTDPAVSFEPYRRRLLGLGYRMLGSMADAEDAVQETYLRWHGADRDNVSDPRAFLMTTTA